WGRTFDVIVVDDGSSDETREVVQAFARRAPVIRLIASQFNRGKGHAVREGMNAAEGRICVMTDADGSTPASEIPKLLAPLLAGKAQVSIGCRYSTGAKVTVRQPLYRRLWSRGANL